MPMSILRRSFVRLLLVVMLAVLAAVPQVHAQAPSESELLGWMKEASSKKLPELIARSADVDNPSDALRDRLIDFLQHSDLAVRRAAALHLGKVSRDRMAQDALIGLLDGEAGARAGDPVWLAAAQGLSFMGEAVGPRLIELLDHTSPRVQRAALVAIHDLPAPATDAVPKIVELLRADNDATRVACLATLRRIGPAAAPGLPVMIEMVDHKDFHTRYWSCRAIGALGPAAKPGLATLREKLKGGGPTVRGNAALALGAIGRAGGFESVQALTAALDDPIYSVKERTLKALLSFGKDAKPATEKALLHLRGGQAELRTHAARLLASMGVHVDESIEVLVKELNDVQCPWVAAEHLGALGDTAAGAIPELRKALRSELPETQLFAAEALGKLKAQSAIPDLERLAQEGEADVAAAARDAAELIKSNSK